MDKSKVKKVMGEYKKGELHSGSKSGPVVKNPKQAIAIAMSEAGAKKKGPVKSIAEMRERAKAMKKA